MNSKYLWQHIANIPKSYIVGVFGSAPLKPTASQRPIACSELVLPTNLNNQKPSFYPMFILDSQSVNDLVYNNLQ